MPNLLTQFLRGASVFLLIAGSALAQSQINVGLNVIYTNPLNSASGGTWQLVAKSTDQGIASLIVPLANVSGTITRVAPRGIVNTSASVSPNDPAGFDVFTTTNVSGQFTAIAFAQSHRPAETSPGIFEQAGVFYGVGTLTNGSPDFPGKPMGTNSIGPALSTLSGVTGVPWATADVFGDAAWSTAAVLATGTFTGFAAPQFSTSVGSPNNSFLSGSVFLSLGTATSVGSISGKDVAALTTTLRTNLMSADYNRNGVIDAADYTVWRDTLGATVSPGTGADGSRNGVIDQADYTFWVAAWPTNPPAVPLSAAIPEASAFFSAAFAGGAMVAFRRLNRRPSNRRFPR